jgi:N6-adenosine-specific RNA methylase IME4
MTRGESGAGDELIQIVAALTNDVEALDSMIRSRRPVFAQLGNEAQTSSDAALDQWTQICISADEIRNRAHNALEVVKKHSSA